MKRALVAVGLVWLILSSGAGAGDNVELYAKDGLLRAPLIVREAQGFNGKEYKIDADGKWSVLQVIGKKSSSTGKGMLNKERLQKLAEELARYDLVSLKSSTKTAVNPQVLAIEFGRINCAMYLPPGTPLPKPNGGAAASMAERYSGVLQAVKDAVSGRR